MADQDAVPGDESLVAKPGTTLKDLQGVLPSDDDPIPKVAPKLKVVGSAVLSEYVDIKKKPGEPLTDDECDLLGLPPGSVMPEPVTTEVFTEPEGPPPFALDPEELPGMSEPEGSTRTHHTREAEEEAVAAPENSKTVDQVAAEAKGFFDALVGRGFSRAEALELTKEVVKVRAKE